MGLHFLAFLPLRGQLLAPPPQVAKNGLFALRPYNGFISAVTGSILQFLAFWAFISLHFGIVGLHFLLFWPSGLSFPCILALWAFISLRFSLFGFRFLARWPCGPSFLVTFWAGNFDETASGQTQAVARSLNHSALCVPPLIGGLGG